MDKDRMVYYRERLRQEGARVVQTVASVEEAARTGTSGPTAGNLSNVPMHLGDLGTEVYLQELNATVLENELYLRDEIGAAIDRIDDGTFGRCEGCGQEIAEGRLQILPYARHCAACAQRLQSGLAVNLNEGRRRAELRQEGEGKPAEEIDRSDAHATGTPGGGTAVGGLAGTNTPAGDPGDADLESAMGSGNFDVNLVEEASDPGAYGGPSGGAVGGTPAGKRAVGGTTHGGLAPHPGPGDSPTGP